MFYQPVHLVTPAANVAGNPGVGRESSLTRETVLSCSQVTFKCVRSVTSTLKLISRTQNDVLESLQPAAGLNSLTTQPVTSHWSLFIALTAHDFTGDQ